MTTFDRLETGYGILIDAGLVASLIPSLFVNDNLGGGCTAVGGISRIPGK
jgi:hypothetical protein